jgi:hypothetical protein
MTENDIFRSLLRLFTTHKYVINNVFVFRDDWESDYFGMTDSGYAYEVEIKISRSDFKKDFTKKDKHKTLSHKGTHIVRNVFGLGAVVSACACGNCAKPVLAAGGIIQH